MLESLNGGKPIKESRDVDLPLAAAHFFYYAGWADKLEYAFPNRKPRPVGVAGQIIPWNFPLLMLAWKIAPALAAGNTVVLKPAETTPLTALLFCDVLRQAELPPGVVNIVTGDGRTGAALVKHPDVDKIAFTGSTEVGKAIQRELAGTGKKLTLELGGKAANIIFDDAALDQAVEGIVNGIYFNQGHVCCAGSRLLVQESIYEPLIEKLKRRLTTLRVGDPLDKNTDVGAINSRAAAGEDQGARRGGRGGGRGDLPAAVPPAREGLLVRADGLHERRAELPDRAGGDLRARCSRCSRSARPTRRSRRRTTRRTGSRPASGRRRARASSGWRSGCAPAWSGRTRTTASIRPRRSAATRSPASAARAAATASSRTWSSMMSRASRQEDLQALHRRRVPALRVGAHLRGRGRERRPRLAQGPPRRRPRGARRVRRSWAGMTAYNRGQVSTGSPRCSRRAAPSSPSSARAPSEVDRSIDRLVWYAGWADKLAQVLGSSNPVAGPYFNFTVPEPTGVVGILAPDEPPLLGLVSRVAPAIVGGNATVVVASETHPLAAVELAEVLATSDVPGGVVNLLTGYREELAPWLAGHMDVNAHRPRRRRRAGRGARAARRGEREARRPRRSRTGRARGRSRPSSS